MTNVPQPNRATASFEEVTISNMVLTEALVELLVEKRILSREEIFERVKKVKSESMQSNRGRR